MKWDFCFVRSGCGKLEFDSILKFSNIITKDFAYKNTYSIITALEKICLSINQISPRMKFLFLILPACY